MTQDIAGRSVRFTSVLNLKMLWNHHLTNCKQTAENRRISDERDKLTHLFHYVCREDSGGEGSTEDVRKLLVKAADTHLLKVPVWADDGLARLSGLSFPWRRVGQKKKNSKYVALIHSAGVIWDPRMIICSEINIVPTISVIYKILFLTDVFNKWSQRSYNQSLSQSNIVLKVKSVSGGTVCCCYQQCVKSAPLWFL